MCPRFDLLICRDTNTTTFRKMVYKKGKRKVQGVPQTQTAALPRHQEEKETDKTKQAQIEQTYEKHNGSLFPKRGNRNAKMIVKHKNKKTQGKISNKSPRRITTKQQRVNKGKRKVQEVPQSQTAALPRTQEERKPTNPNKRKLNKRTKSTKISSLFPKWGNRNTKRTEKHKNKMTHGTTHNKSPRRINHKATNNKTNTGTTALERSVQ